MHPALAAILISQPATPPAAPAADLTTLDGLMREFYSVLAGPAGAPRDWDRMRALFTPDARMVSVGPRPEGTLAPRVFTVDAYIERARPILQEQGYFGREIARTVQQYGQMAHVLSTFEARHAPADPQPIQRGLNSLQLAHDGRRWWIAGLVWRSEDAALPLPEAYLPPRR